MESKNFLDDINLDIYIGNLNVRIFRLNRTFPNDSGFSQEHAHSAFEFHIYPSGNATLKISGKNVKLTQGGILVTGPNIRHGMVADFSNPPLEYSLKCMIEMVDTPNTSDGFSKFEAKLILDSLSKEYICLFNDTYYITKKFEEIFYEFEKKIPGYYLKIQLLILNIIVDIFRTVVSPEIICKRYELPKKNISKYFAEKLVGVIETEYKRHITMQELESFFKVSSKKLNQYMKEEYNMTVHKYLMNYRLETAKKLLRTTELSNDEIAFEAGFTSPSYMYQTFKNLGESLPSEMRNINNKVILKSR